jgi:hypothetical protein
MQVSSVVLSVLLGHVAHAAGLCEKWSASEKAGDLNSKIVDESSGMARSKKYDVLYHTNDSGMKAEFYVSNLDGSDAKTVKIDDFTPLDPEEIGLGPCPKKPGESCIVMADIGDNLTRRKSIAFFFIEEQKTFPAKVSPDFVARFKYPGAPHNAEAMAVLGNGDVIVITKEMPKLGKTGLAEVFRARRAKYINAKGSPVELEKIGELDLPRITKQLGFGALVTAMSAVADGKRFAVLTYATAVEFELDLNAGNLPKPSDLKEGVHYRVVPLAPLPQQESLAYDKNDRDLFYSTEVMQRIFGFGAPAPLFKIKCAQ